MTSRLVPIPSPPVPAARGSSRQALRHPDSLPPCSCCYTRGGQCFEHGTFRQFETVKTCSVIAQRKLVHRQRIFEKEDREPERSFWSCCKLNGSGLVNAAYRGLAARILASISRYSTVMAGFPVRQWPLPRDRIWSAIRSDERSWNATGRPESVRRAAAPGPRLDGFLRGTRPAVEQRARAAAFGGSKARTLFPASGCSRSSSIKTRTRNRTDRARC